MSALAARAQDLDWQTVDSSNVSAVAYDADFQRLYIQYKGGSTYVYEDIPSNVWQSLLSADSIGEFIYDEIRGANGKRADKARGIPAPNLDYLYSYRSLGKIVLPTK